MTIPPETTPSNPPDNSLPPGNRNPPSMVVICGWIILAMFVMGIAGLAWFQQLRKQRVEPPPPVYSEKLSAPTFTDETGTSFPISSLDGRIWVVDFIFTRCGGQCPLMTNNMTQLQKWLQENEMGNVKLVSITVDPEHDTPEVLTRYAKNFKAIPGKWHFLTGDRKTIYDFILNDFKLETEENQGKALAELFVHSDKFVLVDSNRQIRGYYSGTEDRDAVPSELENLRQAIISLSHQSQSTAAK